MADSGESEMSDVSPRIVDWLCSVMELLREPMMTMPTQKILDRLRTCYDSTAASWNWRNPNGETGMTFTPKDIVLVPPARDAGPAGARGDAHPLIMWFVPDHNATSPAHSTKPTAAVSDNQWLSQLGMECQLRIPYRLDGATSRTYSVARGGKEYSDNDLTLAWHIQQSLITVDQQIGVLARLSTGPDVAATAADFQLTARRAAPPGPPPAGSGVPRGPWRNILSAAFASLASATGSMRCAWRRRPAWLRPPRRPTRRARPRRHPRGGWNLRASTPLSSAEPCRSRRQADRLLNGGG
jgi:hypothetical protein